MGKFLTRAFIFVLLGLTIYLYVRIVDLQRSNAQLAASLTQMRALQTENASLRLQLTQKTAAIEGHAADHGWLELAQAHFKAAKQAVAQGNFSQAADESRLASDILSSEARSASERSRAAALSLHTKIASLQARAKDLLHTFGG